MSSDPHIVTTSHSVTAKFPVPTYASVHNINAGDTLNYIFQCVARKVPELCKAYTPGKPDQDIHLRLARLEHIIEIALPQFASGSGLSSKRGQSREYARSLSPSVDAGTHSQAEEDDFGGGTFQSGKWYGTSAAGSIAPASVLQQVRIPIPPGS
jgi:hypothetical protein